MPPLLRRLSVPEYTSGVKDRMDLAFKATAFEYIKGGNIKTNGPVKDPPINAITMSNLGTDSPTATPRKTIADLMAHLFHPKSVVQVRVLCKPGSLDHNFLNSYHSKILTSFNIALVF